MDVFKVQELESATHSFSPLRLIGRGSHGSVYRGVLEDGSQVAIKKQSLGLQKLRDNIKINNEALILSSIHPNPYVVNFLGISHDADDNKIIVTEYMPNGTLHQLLHLSTTPPPWRRRVKIALQVAKGLSCLHESNPPIVHRDIKSANILLDENWNAKLADFGLATQLHDEFQAKLPAGTIGYIDPSYTTPSKLSTKIDVFSFGVVLLELISGREVIDVCKSPASIVEWALPLIEEGWTTELCDKRVCKSLYARCALKKLLSVASRCLSPKQGIRPSMVEVIANLEGLLTNSIDQFPWSMNCIREMFLWLMRRRKKSKNSGNCRAIMTSDDRESGVGSNNISKGRFIVREILADITLK